MRQINPSTATAVGTPIRAGRGPAGVTVGGGLVWVANSRSDTVTRVDPSILAILGDPIAVGGGPGGIDAGPNLVWVASAADDTVSRIDIENGDVVGDPIDVGARTGGDLDRRRSRLGRQQRRRDGNPDRALTTRIG